MILVASKLGCIALCPYKAHVHQYMLKIVFLQNAENFVKINLFLQKKHRNQNKYYYRTLSAVTSSHETTLATGHTDSMQIIDGVTCHHLRCNLL